MDIKKELSEIMSKIDRTVVTEEEFHEIFVITCQFDSIRERMRELEKMYIELSVKKNEWWNKMYEKYGLDGSISYQFLPSTREITRRKDNV